jgi:hypothetical protein
MSWRFVEDPGWGELHLATWKILGISTCRSRDDGLKDTRTAVATRCSYGGER